MRSRFGIAALFAFGLGACGSPALPPVSTSINEAPASPTIHITTGVSPAETTRAPATQPPLPTESAGGMAIAPGTLAQLRLLWHASYPGDPTAAPGCDPRLRPCPLLTNVAGYAFSPDGHTLAVGICSGFRTEDRSKADQAVWGCTGETEIVLYDSWSGAERKHFVSAGLPLSLAFHPDGKTLAAGLASHAIELWDLPSGQRSGTLEGSAQPDGVYRLGFTSDGDVLVSAGGLQLEVWDWRSAEVRVTIENVIGLGLSSDGASLATLHLGGQGTDRIRIYDLGQRDTFLEIPPDPQVPQPTEFSFNPKTGWLATIDRAYGSQIDFWDVESRSVVASFDFRREYDETGALYYFTDDFTPDGLYLALRAGALTSPEAQPAATGLNEGLWACGYALIDLEADRSFFTPPMLYDDCAGPRYLYDMAGSGFAQVLSSPGGDIAADDGFGNLRVWGIDPTLDIGPPECSGACPVP